MASIRVIIFQEADAWVAQCLEHDIAAQAADLETVRSRLFVTLMAEADSISEIPPAPRHFQEMWDRKATPFRHNSTLSKGDLSVELALAA